MVSIVPLLASVPDGVDYGVVRHHVQSFEGDGADQAEIPDQRPDAIPMSGTVTITPTVGTMRWPNLEPPTTSVMAKIVCPVIDGDLYAPNTTAEAVAAGGVVKGVAVVATEQPTALPSKVQYKVEWNLVGARVQPPSVTIEVPAHGVVDLTTVIPSSAEPGTVIVVSTETADRAEAAADLVAAMSAGVASPARTVQWSGIVELPDSGGFIEATLVGDAILDLWPRGATAEIINVLVRQDSAGGRTLTVPDALIAFGVPYTASVAANAVDLLSLVWTGTQWLSLPGALNLRLPQ